MGLDQSRLDAIDRMLDANLSQMGHQGLPAAPTVAMRQPQPQVLPSAIPARWAEPQGPAGKGITSVVEKRRQYRRRQNHRPEQTDVLVQWFEENRMDPYPSPEQKVLLAQATGLDVGQIEHCARVHPLPAPRGLGSHLGRRCLQGLPIGGSDTGDTCRTWGMAIRPAN